MTFRPMPVLSLLSVISLGILIWLGNWQYARFETKRAPDYQDGGALAQFETVTMRLHPGATGNVQNVQAILTGETVWRRYVPVLIGEELALYPYEAIGGINPVGQALGAVDLPDEATVNMFRKPAERGVFTAKDQPEQDMWFTRDGAAMAANMGLDGQDPLYAEPRQLTVRLGADESRVRAADNPYAYAQTRDPLPAERHFGYALTWWGMAIGLLGVYLVFHHSRGRLRFRA